MPGSGGGPGPEDRGLWPVVRSPSKLQADAAKAGPPAPEGISPDGAHGGPPQPEQPRDIQPEEVARHLPTVLSVEVMEH